MFSKARIRRMNLRQRKKMHVAEFQQFGVPVDVAFSNALTDEEAMAFLQGLIAWAHQNDVHLTGGFTALPMLECELMVVPDAGRAVASPVLDALQSMIEGNPNVKSVRRAEPIDAWYGVRIEGEAA